jgi:hypothetical protein
MRAFRATLARLAKQLALRRAGGLFESEYLRSLGFDVRTVIDVGVGRGTKPLYEAFNDCLFVLVDPRPEAESMLRDKPADMCSSTRRWRRQRASASFENKRQARRPFLNAPR